MPSNCIVFYHSASFFTTASKMGHDIINSEPMEIIDLNNKRIGCQCDSTRPYLQRQGYGEQTF